ncbi:unnamed protein product, partial [Heterosigma akashiwo]
PAAACAVVVVACQAVGAPSVLGGGGRGPRADLTPERLPVNQAAHQALLHVQELEPRAGQVLEVDREDLVAAVVVVVRGGAVLTILEVVFRVGKALGPGHEDGPLL